MTAKEIVDVYKDTGSIKDTATQLHISYQTVRRTLASFGIFASEHSAYIAKLYEDGAEVKDIAASLGVEPRTIITHLPYSRGPYYLPSDRKTANALKIAKFRERRKETIDKQPGHEVK